LFESIWCNTRNGRCVTDDLTSLSNDHSLTNDIIRTCESVVKSWEEKYGQNLFQEDSQTSGRSIDFVLISLYDNQVENVSSCLRVGHIVRVGVATTWHHSDFITALKKKFLLYISEKQMNCMKRLFQNLFQNARFPPLRRRTLGLLAKPISELPAHYSLLRETICSRVKAMYITTDDIDEIVRSCYGLHDAVKYYQARGHITMGHLLNIAKENVWDYRVINAIMVEQFNLSFRSEMKFIQIKEYIDTQRCILVRANMVIKSSSSAFVWFDKPISSTFVRTHVLVVVPDKPTDTVRELTGNESSQHGGTSRRKRTIPQRRPGYGKLQRLTVTNSSDGPGWCLIDSH